MRGTIPFHLFWITHPTIRQLGALSKRDFSIILELCVKWPMAICQKCTLASMMMPFWKLTVNHTRFSFFYSNFFLTIPQCNNNIAKSENFFMEKQKNIFIFSLSNLNWCILEFNLKVFNLSTNHLLCNNREKFRVYVKIRVNITTSCVSLIFLFFFLLNFFLCKIREWKFDKFFMLYPIFIHTLFW